MALALTIFGSEGMVDFEEVGRKEGREFGGDGFIGAVVGFGDRSSDGGLGVGIVTKSNGLADTFLEGIGTHEGIDGTRDGGMGGAPADGGVLFADVVHGGRAGDLEFGFEKVSDVFFVVTFTREEDGDRNGLCNADTVGVIVGTFCGGGGFAKDVLHRVKGPCDRRDAHRGTIPKAVVGNGRAVLDP